MRRHWKTIALCVFAAALVVAVLLDRGAITTDEAAQHEGRLFGAWRDGELSEVRIEHGDQRFELLRTLKGQDPDDEPWRLAVGEREHDADQQEVGQLLAALELARYERPVEVAGMDRRTLGFDPPALAFALQMGELRYRLRLGATAPSPVGGRYAEIEGGGQAPKVVVISAQLFSELQVTAQDLRTRELLPYPTSRIQRLVLIGPDGAPRWSLEPASGPAAAAGHWVTEGPSETRSRADHRVLTALLVQLAQLEASNFVPDDFENPAPAAAQLGLRIELGGPRPKTVGLEWHGSCPNGAGRLLIRRTPRLLAACVADRALERFDLPADKLLDRHVVGAAEPNIFEIALRGGKVAVEVARKGAGWHMRSPRAGTADPKATGQWLQRLLKVRGTLVPPSKAADLEALGLRPPRLRIRVVSLSEPAAQDASAERVEQIEIGANQGDQVYVRRLEDGAVLELTADRAEALAASATVLRSTELTKLKGRWFRSLRIRAGEVVLHIERAEDDAPWRLLEPRGAGLTPDPTLVAQLVERLAKLQAVRWAADRPVGSHGLAEPWCTIEAELSPTPRIESADGGRAQQPQQTLRLVLGAETGDGFYAQHDDDPAVCVVAKPLGHLAQRWLLDRAALMVQSGSVAKVVLETPSGSSPLVVVREDERWTVEGRPADGSTASLVRDTLRDLLAEGVVRLGAPQPQEGFSEPVLTVRVERVGELGTARAPVTLLVGAGNVWRNTSVFYLRRDDIAATYAVAQARVQPLLDLF